MSTEDRRAPGATRMPFDGLVEVGGALGPSFEAQAMNVSEDGMHLRTAYLPEQGQPLTCRFDGGSGHERPRRRARSSGPRGPTRAASSASASPTWTRRASTRSSASAASPPAVPPPPHASLGVEGAPAHRRARVADAREDQGLARDGGHRRQRPRASCRSARQLELEDAQSGNKRPACIDRVDVAVDPASHVPQLVVTLRYADVQAPIPGAEPRQGWAPAASAAPAADDLAAVEEASAMMKGALARNLTRVGPAIERLARAREDHGGPPREAAPRGAVAGTSNDGAAARRGAPRLRPARGPRREGAAEDERDHREERDGDQAQSRPRERRHAGGDPRRDRAQEDAPRRRPTRPSAPARLERRHRRGGDGLVCRARGRCARTHHGARAASRVARPRSPPTTRPTPPRRATRSTRASRRSATDPCTTATSCVSRWTGAIESIEGAQQPTGFTVKIPGRKSLEAAAPLAARDSRIAAIKVTNEARAPSSPSPSRTACRTTR